MRKLALTGLALALTASVAWADAVAPSDVKFDDGPWHNH